MNRAGEDKYDRIAEPFPPPGSLGLVEVRRARLGGPFELRSGESLPEMELVYETYGELNPARSNAVLICHALSGDHHAAGYHSPQDRKPGWWNTMIGPGKAIDTDRFHVVSCNNLGGCGGSTGPSSIDPRTGRHYGPDFPQVTVQDWVRSQALLAEHLGIERWAAVVGGSLGGMQALQWGIDFPDRIGHAICIAATPSLTAQNIAFNEVARQAILTDPDYHGGRYYDQPTKPDRGLRIARMLAHITYLSDAILSSRFGRTLRHVEELEDDIIFEIERYLNYQGDAFVKRFDANTYLLITRVLDLYDPAGDIGGTLTDAMKGVKADLLVVSFSSDWRFSPKRSREIVRAAHDNNLNVTYAEIESSHGHDTFLLDRIPQYTDVFRAYMERIAREL